MKKVKILQYFRGYNPGEICGLPPVIAEKAIALGIAEAIVDEPPPEPEKPKPQKRRKNVKRDSHRDE